jgi:hypothetical protein
MQQASRNQTPAYGQGTIAHTWPEPHRIGAAHTWQACSPEDHPNKGRVLVGEGEQVSDGEVKWWVME